MDSDDFFAYILDSDLVQIALPDWPARMSLAVCLSADGDCKMIVGQSDETAQLLTRVASVIERPERSFKVAPQVEGWPTRAVRFSEEQNILHLVSEAQHLVEIAEEFAKDPKRAEANASEEVTREEVARTVRRRLNLALVANRTIAKPKAAEPAETSEGMPAGFASLKAPSRRDCQFSTGHIGGHGKMIRVMLLPDQVSIQTAPAKATTIGFSSDFRHFYLPRTVLKGWKAGQAAIIDIDPEDFPPALRAVFLKQRFMIDATVTSEGVFLTHGLAVPAETPATAVPKRRSRLPLRAAAVAALALIGAGGALATLAVQQDANHIAEIDLAFWDNQ